MTEAEASPNHAFQRARTLHREGHLSEARVLYRQALQREPAHFDSLHLLGVIELQSGQPALALELLDNAIRVNPRNAAAHLHRGNALYGLAHYDAAIDSYDRAIGLKFDNADAYYNRAMVLRDLKRYETALASYDAAILLRPGNAHAYNNRALVLSELARHEAAIESCDKAIAIDPRNAEAYLNRGNALRDLKRYEDAIASYDQALALRPEFAQALNNRGLALFDLGQIPAAVASYDRALALEAGYAEAYLNRGNALRLLKQLDAALASYQRAVELKPDYAEAHSNCGIVWKELRQWDAALASFDRAIEVAPDHAEAYSNRGALFGELRRHDEAAANFNQAIAIKPDLNGAHSMRLHSRMHSCDWGTYEAELAELQARIEKDQGAESPFCLTALFDSASLLKKAAESWVRREFPVNTALGTLPGRNGHERVRVGYFSADYREHPVSQLLAGVIERHDRSRFEVVGFSFGRDTQDAMRQRMERAFERFVDVRERTDRQIAELARELRIDVAVDLGGFTQDSRPGVFALRSAPLQINYLGYPGTMGAPYMDYVIADRTIIPEGSAGHYAEKVVYLPESYQPNDQTRGMAQRVYERAECALPQQGFVYSCFNNSYKITPGVFAGWMRILKRVVGSVLWLSQGNASAVRNLREEAQRHGVSPQRLVFAERLPSLGEHLARQRVADLFLDTLPFNAHTTGSDALWAGLPVLTRVGESFAGRVGASLLRAVGLEELITETAAQYEDLAVELASDAARLANIRARLAEQRLRAPLFDTARTTRHLECAYSLIYERHQAGLPPDHVHVEPHPAPAATFARSMPTL
jgi:protein O-GlcNAc transferase